VAVIRRVINEMAADVELEKVTDMKALAQAGVLSTPAVAVDGVMKMTGRIPRPQDVRNWIAE
jgi:small redox-active disulfide protein 2